MSLLPSSFHGTSLRAAMAGGFKLSETAYSAQLKTPDHFHEFAYLGIVLEGESNQTLAKSVCLRRPGTITYYPPGEVHSDHFLTPRVRLLQIEILPGRLAEISGELTPRISKSVFESNVNRALLVNRLRTELHHADELSPLAIEGLALEVVAEVWRPVQFSSPRPPVWLKQASDLIQDRFAEQLSLSGIAREVDMHPSHLAREFRRFYRKSIGEKIRELRVEFACYELRHSGKPLADIAMLAGFCDQAHFSRLFRRLTGTTPDQFRRTVPSRKSGANKA